MHWSRYNPAPFVLWKFNWIREGAGLTNLIYYCNVHEKDILVAESYAGLWGVLVDKVLA